MGEVEVLKKVLDEEENDSARQNNDLTVKTETYNLTDANCGS